MLLPDKKYPGFVSEVSIEALGPPGLNAFITNVSSSRTQMFCSHLGQALITQGATKKRIVTGIERELGKYTFSVKMPVDGKILKVIQRYPLTVGEGAIRENPESLVIYEDFKTKMIDCFILPKYHALHKDFGFKYVTRNTEKLIADSHVHAGTVFAQTPSLDMDSNYKYGQEVNTAFMSVPQIIEDGVVISRSLQKRLTTRAYGKRVFKWGKKHYPLNLYPDGDRFKAYPDIGEYIRPDGLLFGLRTHDPSLAPVQMGRESIRTPDYTYDKLTYAEPGARVIDVKVWCERSGKLMTPAGMNEQSDRYARASSLYYKNILDEYNRLKSRDSRNFRIGPMFQRMVTEAIADQGVPGQDKVQKIYRMQPLDEYRVEVTYEYDLIPTIGYKITGCHGNKGVICDVWEDWRMPVDQNGNRADLIMDGHSTTKRMNPGLMIEHYINGASRDVSERVRGMLGLDRVSPADADIRTALQSATAVNAAFEYLLSYYNAISYRMWALCEKLQGAQRVKHVESIVREGIYLWIPTDNEYPIVEVIKEIRDRFPQVHGPVKYTGSSGVESTTALPIFIASMYIMLLEKTGENWAAVASARLQHFGIPAKLTNEDKYAAPARQQPVRTLGESEVRSWEATVGPEIVADLIDQSSNPTVHKEIIRNILRADRPNSIERVIDRNRFPVGSSRPLVYYRHVLECAGVRLVRRRGSDHV
jgi:hypothetical protein